MGLHHPPQESVEPCVSAQAAGPSGAEAPRVQRVVDDDDQNGLKAKPDEMLSDDTRAKLEAVNNSHKETEATELMDRKGKFLNFHPYDAGWMQNPQNESYYYDIRKEYEQSPVEAKLLADTADATVDGVVYYELLKAYAGDDFYRLRAISGKPVSLVESWQNGTNGTDEVQPIIGDGYHRHGNRRAVDDKFWNFVRNLDAASKLNESHKSIEAYVTEETEFSVEDVAEVKQFATSFVVIIAKEAWKQKVEDPAGTTIVGRYKTNKSTIYAPEGTPKGDLVHTVQHEYSHMIDDAVLGTILLSNYHGENFAAKYDDQLYTLKTEVSAYLEDPSVQNLEINQIIPLIKSHLQKGGYEFLLDSPQKREAFDKFFELIVYINSFIRGLIQECALDPNDRKTQIDFTKKFLALSPSRPVTYKMLERIRETGLYVHGRIAA